MDLYEYLGVKPGASDAVIVRAFRQKLKEAQDSGQPDDVIKKLEFVNSVLSDPQRRARYDRLLQKNPQAAQFNALYQKYLNTPEAPKPKMPVDKRIANFWYHYKALVIAGVFVLIVGIFLIVSSDKGPDPDLRLLLTGNFYVSDTQADIIEKALQPHIKDRNGDGLKTLEIINTAISPSSTELYTAYRTKFMAELALGDKVLLIMDKNNIDQLIENDDTAFADLSQLDPSLPAGTFRFDLSRSPLVTKAFAEAKVELPKGLFVVMLQKNKDRYAKKEDYRNIYDDSAALLKAITADAAPETSSSTQVSSSQAESSSAASTSGESSGS